MSLSGNLEDLPLLDILQIVSFSKRTGHLLIQTAEGDAGIVFRDGIVVAAFTWDSLPVDPRAKALPEDKRYALLRNRIGMALEQLIRLREGQFTFNLAEAAPIFVGGRDVSEEMLPGGVNVQEMLLDLARGMDEDRRDSQAAVEASFAESPSVEDTNPYLISLDDSEAAEALEVTVPALPVAPEPEPEPEPAAAPVQEPEPEAAPLAPEPPPAPAVPAAEPGMLLLVDDEEDIRHALAARLTAGGYQVVEAGDPESAARKARQLGRAGIAFALVVDLGMPSTSGSSFLGGFEVVRRLNKMNLHPPVVLMTEKVSTNVQARARQMAIEQVIFRPGLSKLDAVQFQQDMHAFGDRLVRDVLPLLTPAQPPALDPEEAREEELGGLTREQRSRQFAVLQQRLEELRRPPEPGRIPILVMRVAKEFFERAILFLIKGGEARGLGAFGPGPEGQSLSAIARELAIGLGEPSAFRDVTLTRRPFQGPAPDQRAFRALYERIGQPRPSQVVLLPLVTNRETIAVLFGDNPETGRRPGNLEALEMFVREAGLAFEHAFLQRKVGPLQDPS